MKRTTVLISFLLLSLSSFAQSDKKDGLKRIGGSEDIDVFVSNVLSDAFLDIDGLTDLSDLSELSALSSLSQLSQLSELASLAALADLDDLAGLDITIDYDDWDGSNAVIISIDQLDTKIRKQVRDAVRVKKNVKVKDERN